LAIALEKLNPSSIVSGYRATGLFPFNPNAVHYECLTECARRKYHGAEFCNSVKHDDNPSAGALAEIEAFLGPEAVESFSKCLHGELQVAEAWSAKNAFEIWQHFKTCTMPSGAFDENGFLVAEETVTTTYDMETALEVVLETAVTEDIDAVLLTRDNLMLLGIG
jgi:hypothetical protein